MNQEVTNLILATVAFAIERLARMYHPTTALIENEGVDWTAAFQNTTVVCRYCAQPLEAGLCTHCGGPQ